MKYTTLTAAAFVTIFLVAAVLTDAGNVVVRNGQLNVSGGIYGDSDTFYIDSENDRVGIGTTGPSARLEVNSGETNEVAEFTSNDSTAYISFVDSGGSAAIGTGAGILRLYSNGISTLGMSIQTNGNVGIGTTSPSARLEVNSGETNEVAEFTSNDSTAYISFVDSGGSAAIGTGAGILRLYSNGVSTLGMSIQTDGDIEIMNGNVGIGTTAPGQKLVVDGTDAELWLSDNDTKAGLFADDSGNRANVFFNHDGARKWDIGVNTDQGTSDTLFFRDNGSDYNMVIDASGNVGIGTTEPNNKLHIEGSPVVDSNVNCLLELYLGDNDSISQGIGTGIIFRSKDEASGGRWAAGIDSFKEDVSNSSYNHTLRFFTRTHGVGSLTERMRITSAGNVGIGTTSPGQKLTVGGGDLQIQTAGAPDTYHIRLEANWLWAHPMGLYAAYGGGETEVIGVYGGNTFLGTGNVGINTTSPESRLQVTGGGLCVGSDANCNSDNNNEGVVYSSSTSMTQYDVAEEYPTRENLSEGDVLVLDPDNPVFVKRSEDPYDPLVLGVVSSKPGVLLGGFNGDQYRNEMQVAVALSGRVPVKVSGENGPIQIGDALVSSPVSGHAMKASETGKTLGIALEPFSGPGNGTIMCFVNVGTWVSPEEFGQLKADNEALKQAVCGIDPNAEICAGM